MYVSIDMDKLVFLHKHHDHETLSGLAFLEAPDRSIMIENTERDGWFNRLSSTDMVMLYKNTTGFDMSYKWDEVQRRLMSALVDRIEPTLALADEVAAQVAAVEDQLHAGTPFKYALGAKVPAQAQELFPLKAKPLEDKRQRQIATSLPPPPPPGAVPPAPPAMTTDSAAATTSTVKGGPRPSVRPIVFAACDQELKEWGEAALRANWANHKAKLIEQLTGQGYHQTTVRIKLGEWAKEHGL